MGLQESLPSLFLNLKGRVVTKIEDYSESPCEGELTDWCG
jgi:hypothetical protein